LQVSTDISFSTEKTLINSADIHGTFMEVTNLQRNTTYFWRVNASNSAYAAEWSDIWTFTTLIEPPTPHSPDDHAKGVLIHPTLMWSSIRGATSYRLQVSADSMFLDPSLVFDFTGITDTLLSIRGLEKNIRYFWRINAVGTNDTSDWSRVRVFTTIFRPPNLFSPQDETFDIPPQLTVQWHALSGATAYDVQISTDPGFSSQQIVIHAYGVMDTVLKVAGLSGKSAYCWRVAAMDGPFDGEWSDIWSFTTGDTLAGAQGSDQPLPKQFMLKPNYPNPFNLQTRIPFSIPKTEFVSITVYNMIGRPIAVLVSSRLSTGFYETTWNANQNASGIYWCRMKAGTFSATQKLLLIK
jgi:hypothetical protein